MVYFGATDVAKKELEDLVFGKDLDVARSFPQAKGSDGGEVIEANSV